MIFFAHHELVYSNSKRSSFVIHHYILVYFSGIVLFYFFGGLLLAYCRGGWCQGTAVDLAKVFSNIGRFNSSHLITKETLFK